MRRIVKTLILAFLASASVAQAQENSREYYLRTYERLSEKVGPSGVGVETILDRWQADYPEDVEPVLDHFLYYYSKSQTKQVIVKKEKRHLGNEPVLSLADSLGNVSYYFDDLVFDDTLFGEALGWIDKAVRMDPDRIDLRFYKVAALTGYEKEQPQLALAEILSLIDYHVAVNPPWKHPSYGVDQDFFNSAVQEYCYLFFRYGSPAGYDAFRKISERMNRYYPDNTVFLDNLGSYYFVAAKDNKTALKYYGKVLKIKPSDLTAIKSCILLYRREGNHKMERKYLEMLSVHGENETERQSARVRMEALGAKK